MSTRAAAAREAALIASSLETNRQDVSSSQAAPQKVEKQSVKKRKVAIAKLNSGAANEEVKGGWDELPHNMGKTHGSTANSNEKQPSPAETPMGPPKKKPRKRSYPPQGSEVANISDIKNETSIKDITLEPPIFSLGAATDKASNAVKQERIQDQGEEIPYPETSVKRNSNAKSLVGRARVERKPKRYPAPKKIPLNSIEVQQKVIEPIKSAENTPKRVRRGKSNPYGLSPGESPFPDFPMPTVEDCKEVQELLSKVHGHVEPPKTIPAPSLEVTGCGEVPSVLDALIRTRLSAATTSKNSGYAFAGLVAKYGICEEGIGNGSVDWNRVRDGNVLDLEKAIKRGGLAKSKSISIMKILDMVHEQNMVRRNAFIEERETGKVPDVVGADRMEQGQKDMEIAVVEQNVLSLDYMHGLTPDEAMTEFTKYPGIGVKTASCVILFCLRRPSFAVDTHVWRFCKWLKWVPEGATRDQTFSHCEVRVPDEMKYSLHQLFIRHGKTCGRCRAATGETSEGWSSTVCPIEKLVVRTGKRKGFIPAKTSSASKKGKKSKKADAWEGDMDADDTSEAEEELELNDDDED